MLREIAPDPAVEAESDSRPISPAIAAGWYADPVRAAKHRWWDGSSWTAHLSGDRAQEQARAVEPPAAVAPAVVVASTAAAVAAADAPMSRRRLRELTGPLTTGSEPNPSDAALAQDTATAAARESGAVSASPLETSVESSATAPVERPAEGPAEVRERPASSSDDATRFLDATDRARSSVPRAWVGDAPSLAQLLPGTAARPAVSAGSAVDLPAATAAGVANLSVPARIAPETTPFAPGFLGFTLPPDPFAGPSAPGPSTPKYVPLSAVTVLGTAPTRPVRSRTAAVWLLALLPLVQAAIAWLLVVQLRVAVDLPVQGALLGASLTLSVALAFADRRLLRVRGFERTAPTAFAVLPPVYLLVRALRVGAGVGPFAAWLVIQSVAIAFVAVQLPTVLSMGPVSSSVAPGPAPLVAGPITAAQRATQLTPSGMATALRAQTLAKNVHLSSIVCPAIPSTVDGTAVTCVGILAMVKINLNVVIDSSLPNSAFALVSEAPATS